MTKIFNKQSQKFLRRKLRKVPIGCERKLWSKLRNKRIGYKFYRQFGIGKYIVDFYCPQLELVIEIDGATHCTDEEIENDKIRQTYLESLGLIIKRYYNVDVIKNLSEVLYDIQKICAKLNNTTHPDAFNVKEE